MLITKHPCQILILSLASSKRFMIFEILINAHVNYESFAYKIFSRQNKYIFRI